MENNSILEMVLLVSNRNAELLRLVGTTFNSKVAFLRRMRKKNLIILKSLQKKVCNFFCFIFLSLLTFELSNINWKCSENCNMLTELCGINNFSQYYNNLRFYGAIINLNFIWNIDINNGVYCDLHNKSACLNTVLDTKQNSFQLNPLYIRLPVFINVGLPYHL